MVVECNNLVTHCVYRRHPSIVHAARAKSSCGRTDQASVSHGSTNHRIVRRQDHLSDRHQASPQPVISHLVIVKSSLRYRIDIAQITLPSGRHHMCPLC